MRTKIESVEIIRQTYKSILKFDGYVIHTENKGNIVVKIQNDELCKLAVQQNGSALQYVKEQKNYVN